MQASDKFLFFVSFTARNAQQYLSLKQMNLTEKFQAHWKNSFNHFSKCKFILAVSGGIDSCVMTDLFFNAGFDFAIAHCNFQLRNDESERDEAFVKSLSKKYNKGFL